MKQFVEKIPQFFVFVFCLFSAPGLSEGALYIPDSAIAAGLGGARVQALEADLRALESAGLQFAYDEPDAAVSLDGGNHIDLLAKYTDVPGKFTEMGAYSFYVANGEWWVGAAVLGEAGRESLAARASHGNLYGSPDIDTPPGGALFQSTDGAVWKKIR